MDAAIARYPTEHRRSATMPLLHLWQEHFGFINDEAIFWIAEKLGLQPINILEVVTFYPMFRQHPAGKTHITDLPHAQLCDGGWIGTDGKLVRESGNPALE